MPGLIHDLDIIHLNEGKGCSRVLDLVGVFNFNMEREQHAKTTCSNMHRQNYFMPFHNCDHAKQGSIAIIWIDRWRRAIRQ